MAESVALVRQRQGLTASPARSPRMGSGYRSRVHATRPILYARVLSPLQRNSHAFGTPNRGFGHVGGIHVRDHGITGSSRRRGRTAGNSEIARRVKRCGATARHESKGGLSKPWHRWTATCWTPTCWTATCWAPTERFRWQRLQPGQRKRQRLQSWVVRIPTLLRFRGEWRSQSWSGEWLQSGPERQQFRTRERLQSRRSRWQQRIGRLERPRRRRMEPR